MGTTPTAQLTGSAVGGQMGGGMGSMHGGGMMGGCDTGWMQMDPAECRAMMS